MHWEKGTARPAPHSWVDSGRPRSVRRRTIRAVESSIRPVMALVHVFVHVLDGADAVADLDIDVTIVFQKEIRIVRHHPAVVQ